MSGAGSLPVRCAPPIPKSDAIDIGSGARTVEGEKAHCYRSTLPKEDDPKFFARKAEICVSDRSGLPIEIKVWDLARGKVRQVGHYVNADCEVNTLSDKDFDPDNSAYGF